MTYEYYSQTLRIWTKSKIISIFPKKDLRIPFSERMKLKLTEKQYSFGGLKIQEFYIANNLFIKYTAPDGTSFIRKASEKTNPTP